MRTTSQDIQTDPQRSTNNNRGSTPMFKLGKTSRTIAMGASALALAGGATLTTAGSAQANTYLYNTQLIVSGGGLCLDSNSSGAVYLGACNNGNYQRWNVTSYNNDVANYYSQVQIKDVATGLCLRVHPVGSLGLTSLVVKTDSCDSQNPQDQWNMTWVGNLSGNPSNGVQFLNKETGNANGVYGVCLANTNGLLIPIKTRGNGYPVCQYQNDPIEIWKTQG
ncbi:ricin-type beta-trefoil lectin domain protein [Streptacidiphilus sp. N1-3]|uniref:Ricin-type beta-trefoil lectin domain protein n=1 Tax=Streptacidiphilus alkalitolerans TaxID=3342712 RepID=A0ABV6WW45_9ACTN